MEGERGLTCFARRERGCWQAARSASHCSRWFAPVYSGSGNAVHLCFNRRGFTFSFAGKCSFAPAQPRPAMPARRSAEEEGGLQRREGGGEGQGEAAPALPSVPLTGEEGWRMGSGVKGGGLKPEGMDS